MKITLVLATLTVLVLHACSDHGEEASSVDVVGSDTLTFEGEYRQVNSQGRWMRCTDGRVFTVVGPMADSVHAVYAGAVGRVGDPCKVWLRGGWSADSSIVANRLLHLAPAMRCEARPESAASGAYVLSMHGHGVEQRQVRFDLFPNGDAIQFSTTRAGNEVEEWGSWGVNSDRQLEVRWPQRSAKFLFGMVGDSLMPIAPFPAGIDFAMVRTGAADNSLGVMGSVRGLVEAQGARASERPFGFTVALIELLPGDTGLAVLADSVRARHSLTEDLYERRWENIATPLDLAELVRMLER